MKSMSILIKPCSSNCNMHCDYCFYMDEAQKRSVCNYGHMSDTVHELTVHKILSTTESFCTILFQGGEPTLLGLDYYKRHISYVKKYNTNNIIVAHSIQTNGLLIDQNFAQFFAENHFLVGISIDGTKQTHDNYRKDFSGKGTYDRVLQAVKHLQDNCVDFNVLCTVTNSVAENVEAVYRNFRDHKLRHQQYIPCLDPFEESRGSQIYSLSPPQYGNFLKALFDLWYQDMIANKPIYIRYFYDLLAIMFHQAPASCDLQGYCSNQYVIEADGSVYPCDFYVFDRWRLGSILTDSFSEFDCRRQELGFTEQSLNHSNHCKTCRWFPLCRGGCRRDREQWNSAGNTDNYFCSSYSTFLSYAYPRLQHICGLAHSGSINLFHFDY